MLRTIIACIALLAALALPGCQSARDEAHPRHVSPLTFTKDIAPILFSHCAPCHRPGQLAPFSVLEYDQVKAHARQIAAATTQRVMPPWLPEHGYGQFSNERRVDDHEIEAIRRWVQEGALEGDPRDLPERPTWPEGWQLGTPDLVLTLPQPYRLAAEGADVFRLFVMPVDIPLTRYVRAVEFRPGQTKAVHHATLLIDPSRSTRRLDAEDPEPGYEGMVGEGARFARGHFLGWTPGRAPFREASDQAWRLDRGTDLVMQLHLLPMGRPESIQPSVGLYFTDTPPGRVPMLFKLGSKTIDIPAGRADYTINDSYVLPVDVEVLTVYPHAHYLARQIKAFATLPDGTVQWLLWIKNWDFNWQDVYRYARPVQLPRGSRIAMEYSYDNSAANPRNRHHPPERVMWGPRSTDEMGDLWLQLMPRDNAALAVLETEYSRRELAADIAGAEQLVRAAPDAEKHNLLAVRYAEVGRLEDAKAHLEQALRLRPDYAQAHNNLGSVLQAQGRLAEAIEEFRRALGNTSNTSDDDQVHFNLGNALSAVGRVDEAVDQFRQAILINPESGEAHNNLAVALGSRGRFGEAIRHLRRALDINSDYADAHNNLGLALASTGRRDEAIQHFRRALEIRPDYADARENLKRLEQTR